MLNLKFLKQILRLSVLAVYNLNDLNFKYIQHIN